MDNKLEYNWSTECLSNNKSNELNTCSNLDNNYPSQIQHNRKIIRYATKHKISYEEAIKKVLKR